ncbi:hypothetical protein BT93_L3664 [Corymbia citriodora subsp. variegata]|uniref:Ribonuclease H1 N-terminal domain-containing protein n=1 Tax=Corymbia citriodora subsp. variegata TaxID=360336 RepID=A0A8T0CZ79_CORYI|nr:hypothetical protein BT93_L3664 [Corymbia citriodora subsp. variegata]
MTKTKTEKPIEESKSIEAAASSVSLAINKMENKSENKYYVVYNGPHPGVYNTWHEAHRNIVGLNVAHKSFTSREEATGSFLDFQKKQKKTYAQTITTPLEEVPEARLTVLGKLPMTLEKQPELKKDIESFLQDTKITPEVWFHWSNLARTDSGRNIEAIRACAVDRTETGSKFNIFPGADPRMVLQLFLCGLIENIYPSSNLLEIKNFPESIKKAISNYRKKSGLADRPIFIKLHSSITDWEENDILLPYHLIKLGPSSKKMELGEQKKSTCLPPRPVNISELHHERAMMLSQILFEVNKIEKKTGAKIHHATTKVLIRSTTSNYQEMTDEDLEKSISFEANFLSGNLDVSTTTKIKYCKLVRANPHHQCPNCLVEADEEINGEDIEDY